MKPFIKKNKSLYIPKAYWLLSVFSYILFPVLYIVDKLLVKAYKHVPEQLQPIFIIGAPRSGSTIIYQSITNSLNTVYPNNLTRHFYRNFFSIQLISNYIYKNKPHNNFNSTYGRTYIGGLNAPSEVSGFWYKYLPQKNEYLSVSEVSSKSMNAIRNTIHSISYQIQAPIIFKNQRNTQRLKILASLFPNAKIIIVKRNPANNALSILKAREDFKTPQNEWWSVKPKNHKELEHMPIEERIMNQLYSIEKEIHNSKYLFKKNNIVTIQYDQFCRNPNACIENIITQFGLRKFRKKIKVIPPAIKTNYNKEHSSLINLAHNFDWQSYQNP